jgi:hypothetical protein
MTERVWLHFHQALHNFPGQTRHFIETKAQGNSTNFIFLRTGGLCLLSPEISGILDRCLDAGDVDVSMSGIDIESYCS